MTRHFMYRKQDGAKPFRQITQRQLSNSRRLADKGGIAAPATVTEILPMVKAILDHLGQPLPPDTGDNNIVDRLKMIMFQLDLEEKEEQQEMMNGGVPLVEGMELSQARRLQNARANEDYERRTGRRRPTDEECRRAAAQFSPRKR